MDNLLTMQGRIGAALETLTAWNNAAWGIGGAAGDNDGGLIAHIRAFADGKRKPGMFHDEDAAASIDALADMLEEHTDGGRVVSVTVPTWFKHYAWRRKKEQERQKEKQDAEAAQAANDLMDAVQMLTDEQIEAAVMEIDPNGKNALDVARFFLQELTRRDEKNALEVFRRWKAGA